MSNGILVEYMRFQCYGWMGLGEISFKDTLHSHNDIQSYFLRETLMQFVS